MSDDFARPAEGGGGDRFKAAEAAGHLLIIKVHEVVEVPTKYGDKDAIRADVIDVDEREEYEDTLIFGAALVQNLREQVGKQVLGTMGQGVAAAGQNPPWKLLDYTDADRDRALAYLQNDAPVKGVTVVEDDGGDDADIEALQRKLEQKQKKLLESKLGAKSL